MHRSLPSSAAYETAHFFAFKAYTRAYVIGFTLIA